MVYFLVFDESPAIQGRIKDGTETTREGGFGTQRGVWEATLKSIIKIRLLCICMLNIHGFRKWVKKHLKPSQNESIDFLRVYLPKK